MRLVSNHTGGRARRLLIRSSHHFLNLSLTAVITLAPRRKNGMNLKPRSSWYRLIPSQWRLRSRCEPRRVRHWHAVGLATPSTKSGTIDFNHHTDAYTILRSVPATLGRIQPSAQWVSLIGEKQKNRAAVQWRREYFLCHWRMCMKNT